MNTENQNQNNQPNYDFILQQGTANGAPDQSMPTERKPKNKTFIGLLVGGGVFILVLIVLAIYISVQSGVKPVDTTISGLAGQKASTILANIKSEQYSEAAKALNSDQEDEQITTNLTSVFEQLIIDQCQLSENEKENEARVFSIVCPAAKKEGATVTTTMYIIEGSENARVTYYYLEPQA